MRMRAEPSSDRVVRCPLAQRPGSNAGRLAWTVHVPHADAMSEPTMTARAVSDAVDPRHWRVVFHRLRAVYRTPAYAAGAAFVARVARAADEANHHPDLVLRYGDVTVTLSSHDVGGLSGRDVALAATIAAIADELGLIPAPDRVRDLEIGSTRAP